MTEKTTDPQPQPDPVEVAEAALAAAQREEAARLAELETAKAAAEAAARACLSVASDKLDRAVAARLAARETVAAHEERVAAVRDRRVAAEAGVKAAEIEARRASVESAMFALATLDAASVNRLRQYAADAQDLLIALSQAHALARSERVALSHAGGGGDVPLPALVAAPLLVHGPRPRGSPEAPVDVAASLSALANWLAGEPRRLAEEKLAKEQQAFRREQDRLNRRRLGLDGPEAQEAQAAEDRRSVAASIYRHTPMDYSPAADATALRAAGIASTRVD